MILRDKDNPLFVKKCIILWQVFYNQCWNCCASLTFPHLQENLFLPYANNKGADQPAHPRRLISAFIVRCLDSIIPLVSISEISSLYLVSVTAQTGLSLIWLETPKSGFFMTRLIWATPWENLSSEVCDQIRLKPARSAPGASKGLGILVMAL